ncbi:MAG: glycosyltransferase family 39 protein, partial [Anaerolineales bacterium]|nr:glycosyltransferase family 39 protein [Anaerolineales bacterium]
MHGEIRSSFIRKYKNYFWLLVALFVAFALRVVFLDAQSLWNDEGTSVALSSLSLEAIINGAARDIHPPLYYLLLHFWMPFAGQTEFAVRFLSVIAGVLIVAVTYRVARAFFDDEVAVIAAFLTAFSPFQIYYSQEA